jgi:hypothetical protein
MSRYAAVALEFRISTVNRETRPNTAGAQSAETSTRSSPAEARSYAAASATGSIGLARRSRVSMSESRRSPRNRSLRLLMAA